VVPAAHASQGGLRRPAPTVLAAHAESAHPVLAFEPPVPHRLAPNVAAAVKLDPVGAEALAIARECAILDIKNAALSGQIVQLESKVKQLQTLIVPKAALAVPGQAPAGKAASAPAVAAKDAQLAKKKADFSRWYWIGGGVAALLAVIAAVLLIMRRKKAKGKARADDAAAEPNPDGRPTRLKQLMAKFSLMIMLMRKKKSDEPAEPKDPEA
jgi:hypothetical protein